jgi:hypothetical protein
MDTGLIAAIIIAFVLLRWWLGSLIGRAAERRGCGYLGWSMCSLFIGPLVVWIVYLIFVHWRPIGGSIAVSEQPAPR